MKKSEKNNKKNKTVEKKEPLNEKKIHKRLNKKNVVIFIIKIILAIIISISIYNIASWYFDNKNNDTIAHKVKEKVTKKKNKKGEEVIKVDFDALKKENSETVGYFIMKNPSIEYPVVKGNDNDYYLNHNFNKQYNKGGWIFANYLNRLDGTDKNITLFGHNMKNKSMFGNLYQVLTDDWYNQNKFDMIYITEEGNYKYTIFSVYRIEAEEYYLNNKFLTDEDFYDFINTLKSRSIFNFNQEVSKDDKIITLSTCSGSKYRVVVHAKLVDFVNNK